MSEPVEPGSPALPEELLRELHGYLALEAPFLIRDLPQAASEEELERVLLERLAYRFRTGPRFGGEELWPGVTHEGVVGRSREDVELAIRGFFERRRIKASLTDEERGLMFRTMLLTREVDEFLKRAFDEKQIKWESHASPQKGFRSTGQEAIVGVALRLRRPPAYPPGPDYRGDVVAPVIRDLGALLMFMPDPLHPILVQYGKLGTPVEGRDLHVGDLDRGVLPPAAPLAIAAQTMIGLAYAWKLRGEDRVGVTFIGEGGSSLGEWHEAVNFAAVRRLPLLFLLENNQWALGTHVSEQSVARRFALKAAGYGMPGLTLQGNDPDEIAAAAAWAAARARRGDGPTLIELVTYRRPGHAHHDDDRYHGAGGLAGYELDQERAAWEALDPLVLYEKKLQVGGVLSEEEARALREEVAGQVRAAGEAAADAPWPEARHYRERVEPPPGGRRETWTAGAGGTPPAARAGYGAESPSAEGARNTVVSRAEGGGAVAEGTRRMSYDEAIRQCLRELMAEDPAVFVLGEDVGGRYGGAFGVTRGLAKEFGAARCLNTPLAESAIVGCGVGAALAGMRPVVEMQFADFLAPAFNALVNNAAKVYWRWGKPVPMVVRLPYGGATGVGRPLLGGGPFHSQCPEMWFFRVPGWKIVAPSTPADAKGLLAAAIRDDAPVVYLEAKGLYGLFRTDLREEVPLGAAFEVPLGQAAVRRPGEDLTVLTYGAMTWTALAAAETLAADGIEAEVVELRTLWPLDEAAILASVARTGRALILHEDTRRGGLGGELAAILTERAFFHLDAPIARVTAPDTPVPYSPPLEHDFLPKAEQVVEAARRLVET